MGLTQILKCVITKLYLGPCSEVEIDRAVVAPAAPSSVIYVKKSGCRSPVVGVDDQLE